MGRTSLRTRADRKSSGSVKALAKARVEAIEKMPPALRARMTRVESAINDAVADNLRFYWNIGVICAEVRDSPETFTGSDGTPGLKLIEEALSTQARTLRNAMRFAEMYTREDLEWLIALENTETKFKLHWGHVTYLMSVQDAEKRTKFTEQAVEKMLDPRALHDLIKKRTNRSGGHGRSHEMPKTVPAQLQQICNVSRAWVAKSTTVWNAEDVDAPSVFGNLLMLAPEAITDEMVELAEDMLTVMTELSAAAAKNVTDGTRVLEYMREAAVARQRAAAAEEAAAAAGENARTGRRRTSSRAVRVGA